MDERLRCYLGREIAMRSLILVLALIVSSVANAATYTKPAGVPTVMVPSHGVEVGVWAVQTAIGHGIGVFEQSGSGDWSLCFNCLASVEYPTLDSVVAAAGGPGPYVVSKLDAINAILAQRYPAVAPEPTGTTLDKVNQALQGMALRVVGGVPQIGAK